MIKDQNDTSGDSFNWITDLLAIGNYKAEYSSFDCVLTLVAKTDHMGSNQNQKVIELIDGYGNDTSLFCLAVDYVNNAIQSNKKILIQCHAGRSRSVGVAIRHLMESNDISYSDAIKSIAQKREIYVTKGIQELVYKCRN